MAEAGKRLASILEISAKNICVGMKTMEIDEMSNKLIKEAGCEPAFLNYRPHGAKKSYPATACVSVNDTVVHGIPSDYIIKDGDLVKVDLGLRHKGFFVDSAVTGGAGEMNADKKKLIETTKKALELGIKEAWPGKTLGDIGFAIENFVKVGGFSVVDLLTGHGIGRDLHEEPHVYNFGCRGEGDILKLGMVIAIEPMVAAGKGKLKQLDDDSFATADGSLTAHFEHTVAITKNGPIVLTKI
mgnify:FL=1